ncbi:hypothetical protein GEMRC1_012736 [Eukaryota sp. GEM-RC1]
MITNAFPNLQSLDLNYNRISKFSGNIPNIKFLSVISNSFSTAADLLLPFSKFSKIPLLLNEVHVLGNPFVKTESLSEWLLSTVLPCLSLVRQISNFDGFKISDCLQFFALVSDRHFSFECFNILCGLLSPDPVVASNYCDMIIEKSPTIQNFTVYSMFSIVQALVTLALETKGPHFASTKAIFTLIFLSQDEKVKNHIIGSVLSAFAQEKRHFSTDNLTLLLLLFDSLYGLISTASDDNQNFIANFLNITSWHNFSSVLDLFLDLEQLHLCSVFGVFLFVNVPISQHQINQVIELLIKNKSSANDFFFSSFSSFLKYLTILPLTLTPNQISSCFDLCFDLIDSSFQLPPSISRECPHSSSLSFTFFSSIVSLEDMVIDFTNSNWTTLLVKCYEVLCKNSCPVCVDSALLLLCSVSSKTTSSSSNILVHTITDFSSIELICSLMKNTSKYGSLGCNVLLSAVNSLSDLVSQKGPEFLDDGNLIVLMTGLIGLLRDHKENSELSVIILNCLINISLLPKFRLLSNIDPFEDNDDTDNEQLKSIILEMLSLSQALLNLKELSESLSTLLFNCSTIIVDLNLHQKVILETGLVSASETLFASENTSAVTVKNMLFFFSSIYSELPSYSVSINLITTSLPYIQDKLVTEACLSLLNVYYQFLSHEISIEDHVSHICVIENSLAGFVVSFQAMKYSFVEEQLLFNCLNSFIKFLNLRFKKAF